VISERQPSGVGVALRDPFAWDELAGLARAASGLGYAAVFLPEIAARDTLATITGLAGEVGDIQLGTGVVPLPARAPSLLAMAAATAAERSGGRLILGLGTGPSTPGALDRLRATVLALRGLFRDGRADLDGQRLRLTLQPPAVPIWIAALGPKAVRLAGEVADGVLLNWCTPERVAVARGEIADAATAAGRDPGEITVGVYVRTGEPAAVAAASAGYAAYPAYARQFRAMGLDPDDPASVASGVCLPEDLEAARARLRAYAEAGADLPVVYPVLTRGRHDAAAALARIEAFAP
jgi:alkanesulfonate monooxygenase SsuD/methylene tetrahydromethanopterin reductase-like flavin-dependent oxidoreductase (luciferase family)